MTKERTIPEERTMNKLKKIRNRIYSAISSFMAVTFLTMSVLAEGNIANSVIATGTKS